MVRNEELCLPACLDALAWADHVLVLDSISSDRTCEIASAYRNVQLVRRRFTDFGDQRDFGLNVLAYPNPWVLVVDADEIVSQLLAAEILEVTRQEQAARRDVFMLRRTPWFDGRPLRHNLTARFWLPRLVRPGRVEVHGRVHERIVGKGTPGYLRNRLDHHQFGKGIDHWKARRLSYAVLERAARVAGETGRLRFRDLVAYDRLRRRAAVKGIFQRLPSRWLVYFVVNIVICGAWRDGLAGLRYVAIEAQSQRDADRAIRRTEGC